MKGWNAKGNGRRTREEEGRVREHKGGWESNGDGGGGEEGLKEQ